jgi:hypothetical protein
MTLLLGTGNCLSPVGDSELSIKAGQGNFDRTLRYDELLKRGLFYTPKESDVVIEQ